MPIVRVLVTALLAGAKDGATHSLAESGWLSNVTPEQLRELYADYSRRFITARTELAAMLGETSHNLPSDRPWFAEWYPEAIEAATWRREGRILCLAVEHHDQETPVALVVRCLTDDEIEDLRA